MDYSGAKLEQLEAASTFRVYGLPLDFEQAGAAKQKAKQKWRLIRPCFCVWDSPESPCPCGSETIWWLAAEAIVDEGKAGRKGHEGQELQFFDVLLDSNVMVESVDSVSARALASLGDKISPERVRGLVTAPPGAPGSTYLLDEGIAFGIAILIGVLTEAGAFDSVIDMIDKEKAKRGLS
jgi:hypothetical protein